MTDTPINLLAIAQLAARRAGDMVADNLHRRLDANQLTRYDIKHKLDVEAQIVASGVIQQACKNPAILGEETWDQALPQADVLWIIDPIDGTINFFHGLPFWCCSVAARVKDQVVAGAVYAPELHMLFEATIDGPALCNGAPLHVSATDRLDLALLHTGADKSDGTAAAFRFMHRVAEIAQRPRITGSAALDLCFVAAGKSDGYFEPGIFIWDMAAAGLIVERAGGTCEVLKRHAGYRMAFLATNGKLHAPLRDAILPLL
jgi:myo-inositol-1(or 4)-monophosphatase